MKIQKNKFKALLLIFLLAFSYTEIFAQDEIIEDIGDAPDYAADIGVSIEEAEYRLSIQPEISELNTILLLDTRKDFAGMYIQHQPVYRIYVLFKNQKGPNNHSNTGEIQRRLAKTSWRSFVKVRKVSNSLEELKIVQQIASDLATQLDFPASLGINISRNEVELYVTDKNAFEIALSIAGETLPNEVILLERNEFSVNESDLTAGLSLKQERNSEHCTSGFAVKSATEKGILTAGHCDYDMRFDGKLLDYQTQSFDGSYDVQWHTPPSSSSISITNRVRTCTAFGFSCGSRAIYGAISDVPVGSYVCKYGATTGKTCGTVIDTHFKPDSTKEDTMTRQGIVIDRVVERSPTFIYVSNQNGENLSEAGDSGGPWFIGNYAIGIHTAGGANPKEGIGGLDAIFMPIKYISKLGLSILTQ